MSTVDDAATDARAALIAAAARPRRFGAWYIAEHRLRVMRSYLGTMVATGIGTPIVYLVGLGIGLATIVDRNVGAAAAPEVGYLVFVAPALICASAMSIASEEFSYPVFEGYKWNPVFTGMHAAPISPQQIVDGVVISVVVRVAASSVVYYLLMVAFGAVPDPAGALTIVAAILVGTAFGIPLMAYTSTLQNDTGQLASVMRFVVLPLTLFSGTFFPLAQMPVFLHWIGWISPLWHGSELARVFAYGSPEPAWLTALHVVVLLGYTVAGWLVARRLAVRRLAA